MKALKYATLAFAAAICTMAVAQVVFEENTSARPLIQRPGFYLGTRTQNPESNTLNKMQKHLCHTKVYDFPAVDAVNVALGTPCRDSSALTATGCAYGDRLSLGIDQIIPANTSINAYQTASATQLVRICADGLIDGGSANMPDASFTICCDGN